MNKELKKLRREIEDCIKKYGNGTSFDLLKKIAELNTEESVGYLIKIANGSRLSIFGIIDAWLEEKYIKFRYPPIYQLAAIDVLSKMKNHQALEYVVKTWKLENIKEETIHLPEILMSGKDAYQYSSGPFASGDLPDWIEPASKYTIIRADAPNGRGELAERLAVEDYTILFRKSEGWCYMYTSEILQKAYEQARKSLELIKDNL